MTMMPALAYHQRPSHSGSGHGRRRHAEAKRGEAKRALSNAPVGRAGPISPRAADWLSSDTRDPLAPSPVLLPLLLLFSHAAVSVTHRARRRLAEPEPSAESRCRHSGTWPLGQDRDSFSSAGRPAAVPERQIATDQTTKACPPGTSLLPTPPTCRSLFNLQRPRALTLSITTATP